MLAPVLPRRPFLEQRVVPARKSSRRILPMLRLAMLVILALLVILAPVGPAAAQGAIKIGFLAPLSGAIAQAGKDMYSGCELFWEESGWQIAGRKLEVILEDNEGLPATTLAKARKLVESDHVNMLAGVILSNVSLDYAFGWEIAGGFQRTFEDNGGQIIQKIWVPLNVQDYAPYIGQIRKDADAVFVLALGRWTLLFAKQWAASGLKMPLIAGGTYNDEHVLPQLGDESIGVISAHHYSAALDTPANRRFRAAFEKKFGRLPSFYSENCYTGARVVAEAARAVGGHVEDRAPFMAALRATEIKDAPRGPIKMDPYGNPTQNIYIRKVERVDGKLQNTVIHTYPAVSQFWKYNPEEFLKQPVYSREFPPCRHC